MDNDTKRFLGKILGELHRTRRMLAKKEPVDAHIYALTHGFESAIDAELEEVGWISNDDETAVGEVLDVIYRDQGKLEKFRGFYDIEDDLKARGIDRSKAIRILTKMKAEGAFSGMIHKMDSSHSPSECRRFEIRQDE